MSYDALQIAMHANVPVLLTGAPGVGKTSIIRALCERLGWPIETVIASICEPSDLGGLPVIHNGGVRRIPAEWAVKLAHACKSNTPGVMFFDELGSSAPANQAGVLRISQERVVGDMPLPFSVRFIAASNPVDQAAGGWDLSAPLANRLCHLRWVMDSDVWVKGMQSDFPAPALTNIDPKWEAQLPTMRSLISSFIKAQPQRLVDVPKDDSQKGHAWPSPRTWHMGSRLLACANHQPAAVKAELLSGCVGDGQAVEYFGWLDRLDLPDARETLLNPGKYYRKPKADEEHRAYAILSAAISVAQQESGREMYGLGWELLAHAARWNPDVVMSFVPALIDMRPKNKKWPIPKAAHDFMKKMGKSMDMLPK